METVGLIGLGLVGKALSQRLIGAGYQVLGYDIDAHCREALEQLGGRAAENAKAVASQVDQCLLSLPDSSIATTVLAEIEAFLPSKLVIDTTTGDPQSALDCGQRLLDVHADYVDATIVGSSKQVAAGDVIVLVGGNEDAFQKSLPILSSFAKRSFYLGHWGSGARMKLIVNLVLGLNRAVLAEGLSFAAACGVDAAQALEVLKASAAHSRVMDLKGQKMLQRHFEPEARLAQHHKDVRLILAESTRNGAYVPLSALHDKLLSAAESAGLAEMDNSAIIEVFKHPRGVSDG